MPVPFTAAQMKAWLETGDFPTQQQFADIIDTMMHLNQQALDLAQDAVDTVTSSVPLCSGLVKIFRGGPPISLTVVKQIRCAITLNGVGALISSAGGEEVWEADITVTPTTNLPDTDFIFLATNMSSTLGATQPAVGIEMTVRDVDEVRFKFRVGTKDAFPYTDFGYLNFQILNAV